MPALLILSGLFLIVLGWLWVAGAARRLPVARFVLALLAAPITLFLRGRGYARLPRVLIVAGSILTLGGGALLQQEQPERFRQLLAGDWLAPAAADIEIEGMLMGQPFKPDRVLWRGNDLVFEEGPPQRLRRSLVIRFGQAPALLELPTIERLPGDPGPWPELLLQWHIGALSQPGLLRVTDDYTLSLDFVPRADQSAQVRLHLHLPTRPATLLSGEAVLANIPEWLAGLKKSEPVPATSAPPALRVEGAEVAREVVSPWQDVSVLAVLGEPQLFSGQQVRLTTQAGRLYEGLLTGISEDRRIVLAQRSGANQMDFHFQPIDVAGLQVRYRSSR